MRFATVMATNIKKTHLLESEVTRVQTFVSTWQNPCQQVY